MSAPRVSIILTTYNRADLLAATLDSIRCQMYTAWELIIADDGSTDGTARLLASWTNIPFRYLQLPHSGQPEKGRNAGLAVAQGEFVAFLDDDDRWLPHYLARMVGRLDQDPEVGLVYCDIRFRDPNGRLSSPRLSKRQKHGHRLKAHLLSGGALFPSMIVFRRSLLDRIGLIDVEPRTQGDLAFLLRLVWTTASSCVDEPLAIIRRNSGGLSDQRNRQHFQNAISVWSRFASQTELTVSQRLRLRRTLARFHTHLALLYQQAERDDLAREYLIRSIKLNPLQRQAWVALINTGRR